MTMFLFVLSIFLQDLPSSQYYHISKILELIIAIDPSSVLDVGTGFGKYGVLCREYLELGMVDRNILTLGEE